MSNIILETTKIINQTGRNVPQGKQGRYRSGVNGLSLQPLTSLNEIATGLAPEPSTGSSRLYRMLADKKLGQFLSKELIREIFGKYRGVAWINLDHSAIGNFTVCTAALQTRVGRALPLWFQVNEGSRSARIKPLRAALPALIAEIKAVNRKLPIILVADRWFASETLMKFCVQAASISYLELRWIKSWRHLTVDYPLMS